MSTPTQHTKILIHQGPRKIIHVYLMKSYLDKSDFGKSAIKNAQNPGLAVCHTVCFFGSLPALPIN